jgi:hypothetical protein
MASNKKASVDAEAFLYLAVAKGWPDESRVLRLTFRNHARAQTVKASARR